MRKRFLLLTLVAGALALPATAPAFHHGSIPARECAESDQASNNATARAAIAEKNPVMDPGGTFPPFGTPGEAQGEGGEHCAGAE
jgi:hypothetical protein